MLSKVRLGNFWIWNIKNSKIWKKRYVEQSEAKNIVKLNKAPKILKFGASKPVVRGPLDPRLFLQAVNPTDHCVFIETDVDM